MNMGRKKRWHDFNMQLIGTKLIRACGGVVYTTCFKDAIETPRTRILCTRGSSD